MRTLSIVFLLSLLSIVAFGQTAPKDTLIYFSGARATTTYSRIYIGPAGVQKQVSVSFDTSYTVDSTTMAATLVVGAVTDTLNTVKQILCRLAYQTSIPTFATTQDTIRIKVSFGSVLTNVLALPYPRALQK